MLKGGGALNPDGLALDLAFALDKTLTARKGPTPTFTRGSTGTFVGSNGLIQSAAINVPRFDYDPVTGICKGILIEDTRTNLVFPSETLTTQTRTVAAVAHTLSFYGTGTVVLSGVHSATVIGAGVFPSRTTLTFTPTAGSLTLIVTGTVQFAQLEAGAFPLSYIPTTTGTAARSADVCSIVGTDFSNVWNPTEVTLYAESSRLSLAGILNQSILVASGSGVARLGLYHRSSQGMRLSSLSNGFQTTVASNFNQAGVRYKAAVGLSASSNGVFFGGTEVPNNFPAVPSGFADTLLLSGTIISGPVNGHLASLRIYRKRLSNAKLQALTAP